jgi:2-polyprenyl-3-methyl-5-hydroxy-6-metoxy-1,4-benzoquinol methylase
LFEHLRINPIETLKKINNVINPSGRLLLSTPNLYSIYNIGRFIIGKGFNNAYKEFNKLNTIGHMGHLREYTANEMVQFLSNSGFVNINIHRFSNKTRKNVSIIKSIKNSLTDFICLIFPKLHTHLFIVADKP